MNDVPVHFLQAWQWQMMLLTGCLRIVYRHVPQRQEPVSVSGVAAIVVVCDKMSFLSNEAGVHGEGEMDRGCVGDNGYVTQK